MAGRRTGTTAAAVLPAALAGAALVSAPFAGTTTAPLAKSANRAAVSPAGAAHGAAPVRQADGSASGSGAGVSLDIGGGSLATLVLAEVALVGVGASVIVVARRRRFSED